MNFKKKIVTISLATMLMASPLALMNRQNVQVVTAAKVSQANRLKLNHNAYIYNRRGRRTRYNGRYKLSQGQSVRFVKKAKPMTNSRRYYFKDKQGNNFYLPYARIRGSYYYQIGKNAYVKCANISQVSGQPLYVSQATVTIQAGSAGYSYRPYLINVTQPTNHVSLYNHLPATSNRLKIGQKVTIDSVYYNQDMSNADLTFYRVKGTSGSKTQVIPSIYIHNKPRQMMETDRASSGLRTNTQTPVYNAAGQIISQRGLHKNYIFGSFEKVWLWVPSAHKAELFYQMSNRLWSTKYDDTNADYESGGIVPYLPVSDIIYDEGPTLKPVNTAAQAEADARVATSTDKQELQHLISERNSVTSSTAFRLDPNTDYVGSLILGQKVLNDETATVNQVKEAVRYIQRIKNALNGAKISVKDINHLTRTEASAISSAVREYYDNLNDYSQDNNNDYQVQFNNDRSQMTLITKHYQARKNHEAQYLEKTTRQELKISDYAEQK